MLSKTIFIIFLIYFLNFNNLLIINHILITQLFFIIILIVILKYNFKQKHSSYSILLIVGILFYIYKIYWQIPVYHLSVFLNFYHLTSIKYVSSFF